MDAAVIDDAYESGRDDQCNSRSENERGALRAVMDTEKTRKSCRSRCKRRGKGHHCSCVHLLPAIPHTRGPCPRLLEFLHLSLLLLWLIGSGLVGHWRRALRVLPSVVSDSC